MRSIHNKSTYSILNAVTSILYTGINAALTIIVTRVILVHYGSDYNGLNTTANQIVSILLVLESGFTLASNVALFSPIANKDDDKVSRIISTTKAYFIRIGILYLLVGTAFVIIYSRFVVSDIPYTEVLLILLVSLLPTGFNLIFATKYSVLFQSSQHEYVLNCLKIISCVIANVTVIFLGSMTINRVVLRLMMLLNGFISVVLIIIVGHKKYGYLSMNLKPDNALIPGTKDLMVQKFVGLVYNTAPTLLMSARIGTIAISIYGVYRSVTMLMKSIANAFMNSPRMSLGVLISEKDYNKTRTVFREYENIVFVSASIMTIIYFSLILPFVSLYTRGVNDANYIQPLLAVLLGIIFYVECLHIPSGIYLNMAGLFKVSKIIQLISAFILCIGIGISFIIRTIEAFIISILVAAIALAIMEIGYVHLIDTKENKAMGRLGLKDMLLFIIITSIFSALGFYTHIECKNYFVFIIIASIVAIISIAIIFTFLAIYNKQILQRIRHIIKTFLHVAK